MGLTTGEILRTLEQHAPAIRRHGVRSLGLFGSHARGTAAEQSDLDFVALTNATIIEHLETGATDATEREFIAVGTKHVLLAYPDP